MAVTLHQVALQVKRDIALEEQFKGDTTAQNEPLSLAPQHDLIVG